MTFCYTFNCNLFHQQLHSGSPVLGIDKFLGKHKFTWYSLWEKIPQQLFRIFEDTSSFIIGALHSKRCSPIQEMTKSQRYHKCPFKDISKHLKGRSVPRVSDVFADAKGFVIFLFLDSFRIQGNLSFSCFQTLPYLKDFVIFLFPESFCIERILSFSCFQTLSLFKGFCRFPVSGLKPLNLLNI